MRERQNPTGYLMIESSLYYAAALLSSLIFLIFRVIFISGTGLLGQGLLAPSLYFYMGALLLSCFFIPAAVSRLVSVRMGRKHPADAVRLMRMLCLHMTAAGVFLILFFWFAGPPLAGFAGLRFSGYAIRWMGFVLWLEACLGVMRGYHIGRGNSLPALLSVVTEQLAGGIASLFFNSYFLNYGQKANLLYGETAYTAAFGAEGAVFSFAAGALISLLVLNLMSALSGGSMQEANEGRRMENMDSLFRSELRTFLPVMGTALVLLFGPALDALIYSRHVRSVYGNWEQLAGFFGSAGGAVMLFFILLFAAGGLMAGLMPGIHGAAQQKNRKLLARRIRIFTKSVSAAAFFGCMLIAVLRVPLSVLFFAGEDAALMQGLLLYGFVFLFFGMLSLETCGVLFGLGHFAAPLQHAIICFLSQLILFLILMYAAKLEMFGLLLANGASLAGFWLLNSLYLRGCIRIRRNVRTTWFLPFLSAAVSGFAIFLLHSLFAALLPESIQLMRAAAAVMVILFSLGAAVLSCCFLLFSGAISPGELLEMPLGAMLCGFALNAGFISEEEL
ncbi:MAG: hypothetical protein Q4C63_09160 [Eubacteriales bacterium]|nr:hypothetical protein [Eubacteriales bacterium]